MPAMAKKLLPIRALDPMQFRVTSVGEPGRDGRRSFELEWRPQHGGYRAQCFHADLDAAVARMVEGGYTKVET